MITLGREFALITLELAFGHVDSSTTNTACGRWSVVRRLFLLAFHGDSPERECVRFALHIVALCNTTTLQLSTVIDSITKKNEHENERRNTGPLLI